MNVSEGLRRLAQIFRGIAFLILVGGAVAFLSSTYHWLNETGRSMDFLLIPLFAAAGALPFFAVSYVIKGFISPR